MDGAAAIQDRDTWHSSYRLVPAADTIARVMPFAPAMGITRIANVTGLDEVGIPVVMVCRPNSRSISVSQGKGLTLEAAKASGLMEAVESFHAERIDLPLRLGSVEDLRYSHQLADTSSLPQTAGSGFTPYTQLLWIEGQEILSGEPIWVPYELVHLDYTVSPSSGHGCFLASSNGLASGNQRLEAIDHAICEIIERDASTLWHLMDEGQRAKTRIDLDTVHDERCRRLINRFEGAGVQLAVWETTSDTRVPSFICRAIHGKPPPFSTYRPGCGMGCHVSREIALIRALTEAAQSRLTFIAGARDDMSRKGYEHFLDPQTHERWRRSMDHDGPVRDFAEVPTWDCDDPQELVDLLLERLGSVGITQVIAVDLTKPLFGIPVVRVIVPGLEGVGQSSQYVPGRRAIAAMARVEP